MASTSMLPNGTTLNSHPDQRAGAGNAFELLLDAIADAGSKVQRRGTQASAQCPAHEDRNASLSLSRSDTGVLVNCHAGCSTDDVLAAVKLARRDLFDTPKQRERERSQKPAVVARYDYVDENGQLLYVKERIVPKSFRYFRPVPGRRPEFNLDGTRRVLYRLPEVIAAIKDGRVVYLTEGEKDANTMVRAGVTATTWSDGAWEVGRNHKWRPEYTKALRGADVVIVRDEDGPGRNSSAEIADFLTPVARRVRILRPAAGKDVTDHFEAGLGLADLVPVEKDVEAPAPSVSSTDGADDDSAASPERCAQSDFPPPDDPMAVARRILRDRTQDGVPTLARHGGAWWMWEGPHWAEASDETVKAELYPALEHAVYLATDKKGDVEAVPWSPTKRKIADLMDALGAASFIPESVDAPSWLPVWSGSGQGVVRVGVSTNLQVVGGGQGGHSVLEKFPIRETVATSVCLLNVVTRETAPLTPRFFTRISVPFGYDPDAVEPTNWLAFLDSIWPDDPQAVAALQEWFGYVLSGRTDLHKILLIVGPPRCGKGTIARILTSLVGPGNVAATSPKTLPTDFGMESLIGKTLAVMADARMPSKGTEDLVERLLTISGEDAVPVKRKYRSDWLGRLSVRFMLMSNDLPSFRDHSGAIASRLVILRMSTSFLGREDTGLYDRLIDELPGILNWSLDGLGHLALRGRFAEPESSADAAQRLRDAVSPLQRFLAEETEEGSGFTVRKMDLYEAWRVWCDEEGHNPGAASTFGANLLSAAPNVRVERPREGGGRVQVYSGLRLCEGNNRDFALTTLTTCGNVSDHTLTTPDRAASTGAHGGLQSLQTSSGNSSSTRGVTDFPEGLQALQGPSACRCINRLHGVHRDGCSGAPSVAARLS